MKELIHCINAQQIAFSRSASVLFFVMYSGWNSYSSCKCSNILHIHYNSNISMRTYRLRDCLQTVAEQLDRFNRFTENLMKAAILWMCVSTVILSSYPHVNTNKLQHVLPLTSRDRIQQHC
jgi:hypothetical protein